jgi:hypothetical protein
VATAIAALVGPEIDQDARLEILRALTSDVEGRYVTGEVLSQRTRDRLDDARSAVEAFEALISDDDSDETDLQQFLEDNPWLLGLDWPSERPVANLFR